MLESEKNARVAELINIQNLSLSGTWNWLHPLRGHTLNDLTELANSISSCMLFDRPYTWMRTLDPTDIFTTRSLTAILDNLKLSSFASNEETVCIKSIPKKINIFIWRVKQGRISTRVELDKRGIDLDSIIYPLCNSHVETVEHVLIHCPASSQVWMLVLHWWNLHQIPVTNMEDAISTNLTFSTNALGSII
ncbi:uncharacterized protein [Rutidosis leptorrhynchoides]|uniref:uncharacterized protein n=1 Tax=Rutidosis leptorrhynchoides TaxID=125765 RepID=UPI003A99A5EB